VVIGDRLRKSFQDTKPLLSQSSCRRASAPKAWMPAPPAAPDMSASTISTANWLLRTSRHRRAAKETLDVLLGRTPVVVQVGDELWHP